MVVTRNLLYLLVLCLTLSCHWRTKHAAGALNGASPDTPHKGMIGLVRSYEPARYRGKIPKAYYDDRGAFDYWRFPLVYPYAIDCIDETSYGTLRSEEGITDYSAGGGFSPLTEAFNKFIFDHPTSSAPDAKAPLTTIRSGSPGNTSSSPSTAFMTIDQYGERL